MHSTSELPMHTLDSRRLAPAAHAHRLESEQKHVCLGCFPSSSLLQDNGHAGLCKVWQCLYAVWQLWKSPGTTVELTSSSNTLYAGHYLLSMVLCTSPGQCHHTSHS